MKLPLPEIREKKKQILIQMQRIFFYIVRGWQKSKNKIDAFFTRDAFQTIEACLIKVYECDFPRGNCE